MKNFRYPEVRRGNAGCVVPDVPKNCIAFIFKLKQSYQDQAVLQHIWLLDPEE